MKKKTLLQHLHISTCAGALALLAAGPAGAASPNWTGGATPDGNWSTGGNWDIGAPAANDYLNFTGSSQLLTTNNFTVGTIFNNLSFDSGAGAFTLSGNSLALTNGTDNGLGTPVGGGISNASPSIQTISLPISLMAGRHNIANTGGGTLNLNGTVTRNHSVVAFDTSGAEVGKFGGSVLVNPTGIATDGNGNYYVADAGTKSIIGFH